MFCIELNGAEATLKTIKRRNECCLSRAIDCAVGSIIYQGHAMYEENMNNKISKHIKVKIVNSPIALHSKYLLQSVGGAVSALQ